MKMIDERLLRQLRCPVCEGSLSHAPDSAGCAGCGATFPVVNGVPVLIDEARSLFRIADCLSTGEARERPETWRDSVRAIVDKLKGSSGQNISGREKLGELAERLRAEHDEPRVLVLGGASIGVGADALVLDPKFSVVESDIVIGARTNLVCDAHQIPFEDGTFDAVVAQAVLEYVIDPFQVVSEIHRVLRPKGYVYAESPFMQQVHGGAYDFFRFTHLGHRRLFRYFEETDSGVACGPGMALTWSYRYFLRSLTRNVPLRAVTDTIAVRTSGWLSRLDRPLKDAPGTYDAASAFYFLGRRSETPIPDREIIAGYRGAWKMHR